MRTGQDGLSHRLEALIEKLPEEKRTPLRELLLNLLEPALAQRDSLARLEEKYLLALKEDERDEKVVNIRRNPKVALMVEAGDDYAELRGVMIRGRCEILEDEGRTIGVVTGYGRDSDSATVAHPARRARDVIIRSCFGPSWPGLHQPQRGRRLSRSKGRGARSGMATSGQSFAQCSRSASSA